MEKLQLSSSEQIEIQDGATENVIQVQVESIDAFKELYNKFTDDNLSEISIYNVAEILCAIYKDKTLSKAEIADVTDEEAEDDKLIATLTLKNIDTTKLEIKSLRETVDTLILNTLEVE